MRLQEIRETLEKQLTLLFERFKEKIKLNECMESCALSREMCEIAKTIAQIDAFSAQVNAISSVTPKY